MDSSDSVSFTAKLEITTEKAEVEVGLARSLLKVMLAFGKIRKELRLIR